MKTMIRTILLITLMSNVAFSKEATYLNKGDAAPFDGILLTEQRAEKAMKAEKKVLALEDLRITQDELISHYKEVAKQERKQRIKQEFSNSLKNIGYFLVGTLITAFAFKTVEVTKDF